MTDAEPVCWRCQQPGAEIENIRGEPVHRECRTAYVGDDIVLVEVPHTIQPPEPHVQDRIHR